MIQLTGKSNYSELTRIHNQKSPDDPRDFVATPDLLISDVKYGIESGFVWWSLNNVNALCIGDTDEVVKTVTLKVNGGLIGLADRTAKFRKILQLIGGANT